MSSWFCTECDDSYPLNVEIPSDHSEPFIYLSGMHIHINDKTFDLPDTIIILDSVTCTTIKEHMENILKAGEVDE